mmetsp:Transcript_102584/g.319664  ORF Transcript_102584/g.319664 Transcript_102584/m.319664 type:complete len:409 (-) Transcript_102584:41-1267(-)
MCEDLTKGLNTLLHPKFIELSQRLDRLEVYHQDLSAVVAQKEERHEVERLREHVEAQAKQLDSHIAMLKEKTLSLDQLRSQEIRALAKNVETKAALAQVKHLDDQLQATNVAVANKAEVGKVDQVSKNVHALSHEVSQKASSGRTEQVAKQVQILNDALAKKVDFDTADHLSDRIRTLAGEVALRAESTKLDDLLKKVDLLTQEVAAKADHSNLEQLDRQMRLLSSEVDQRADVRKVEHISRQLHSLHEELGQKAEISAADQAIRQIHALSDAVSVKVEDQKHSLLHDQVAKLREEVFQMKGDFSRLDDHSRQLDSLHSSVAVDSARVKHLCLMYQGSTPPAKDIGPSTPTTAAATPSPGSPPLYTHRTRNLPSMAGSAGTQKPGSVTLPSMATGAPSTSATPYPGKP